YFGEIVLNDPLAQIRHDFGEGSRLFRGRFKEDHNSAYLADRLRIGDSLTLELGVRYDRHSQTSESHASPRLNLAYSLGERSVLRVAWGRFNQSQRPYELQVEDGDTQIYPVERSEHRVIGFERLFETASEGPGLALRVEVYRREVGNPRPRYVNLFEPINEFPEIEPDRVRIEPDRSIAEGIEIFLRGSLGHKIRWWVNYANASTEDEIVGDRVPRLFDQTHALNLDLDLKIKEHWHLNLAWRFHTGWPTTPLSLQEIVDDDGEVEFVPVLGPLNSERLSSYHRLDLRASRRWHFRSASLDFFVDVQNVYDRENLAGFDIEIDDEEGSIVATEEGWVGILPSAGVSVEF
ncbi:MAG: TonB-dependent receptor, partial [Myxococcota bacterium]